MLRGMTIAGINPLQIHSLANPFIGNHLANELPKTFSI